jgi:hypothetical protein
MDRLLSFGARLQAAAHRRSKIEAAFIGDHLTMRRAIVLLGLAALAGCSSPEATRQRGGGPGADVGNRGRVELHAGANQYAKTPVVLPQKAR